MATRTKIVFFFKSLNALDANGSVPCEWIVECNEWISNDEFDGMAFGKGQSTLFTGAVISIHTISLIASNKTNQNQMKQMRIRYWYFIFLIIHFLFIFELRALHGHINSCIDNQLFGNYCVEWRPDTIPPSFPEFLFESGTTVEVLDMSDWSRRKAHAAPMALTQYL